MASAAAAAPKGITVRSYQVGFGDCFLLTFHYPKKGTAAAFDRHVLIDFGSFPLKTIGGKSVLDLVANEIRKDCGGKLHAVVATHRHADHINGFATKANGKGPGDVIAACDPDVVVQPWTEDPDAQPGAKTASKKIPAGHKAFAAALRSMSEVAMLAAAEAERGKGLLRAETGLGQVKVRELGFLGGNNIANRSAVENLIGMGTKAGKKAYYVNYGSKSGLESVLPGVKVYVLGPPTLKQSGAISTQRVNDPDEFWQFQAGALRRAARGGGKGSPFAKSMVDARAGSHPYTRWLVPKLRALRGEQLLEIVRQLDEQMNNTSVILLFETEKQRMLFPGDAQIENWSYALREAANGKRVREKLEGVTFYKVGHHGSRNATPKTLWDGFKGKGAPAGAKTMTSMMSTEPGHHGSAANKSEVPRGTLVAELKAHTHFFTTEAIKAGKMKNVVELEA
jgi:hypothetical protein